MMACISAILFLAHCDLAFGSSRAHRCMSAALDDDVGAHDFLLAHLHPRDVAAVRCRGSCFIEIDADASVDVAVTAFHLIFLISQDGTHASRLAWSDVATMELSKNQGRHCAIMQFFVAESKPNPTLAKPTSSSAPSSPINSKLTKTAQLLERDALIKAAAATVLSSNGKPLLLYVEDIRPNDDEHSIVIASQRAFLHFHFNKQTQLKLSTASLLHDDPALQKQYVALENEVAAAASIDALLPLLEDIEEGARHHSIKGNFLHRPLILNRLIKVLSTNRPPSARPPPGAPSLPPLLSSTANISVATAALRCIAAIACDACRLCVKQDAAAACSAEQCLLAAMAPLTSEAELSDVRMRVALSALLKAQVEAVFHCLSLCFSAPSPAPLASFLFLHLQPEQVTAFVANAVYSTLTLPLPPTPLLESHTLPPPPSPHCSDILCYGRPRFWLTPTIRVRPMKRVKVLQSLILLLLQHCLNQQQQQHYHLQLQQQQQRKVLHLRFPRARR